MSHEGDEANEVEDELDDAFLVHVADCDVCAEALYRHWSAETFCPVGRRMLPDEEWAT